MISFNSWKGIYSDLELCHASGRDLVRFNCVSHQGGAVNFNGVCLDFGKQYIGGLDIFEHVQEVRRSLVSFNGIQGLELLAHDNLFHAD